MPLRALLDGETDLIAPLLPVVEWDRLRREVRGGRTRLVLPCCRATAYQRTSPRGLQHFFHPPQSGCVHAGETHGHLAGKDAILQACLESGYAARTEYAEGPWRADVVAVKDSLRVAFEIQLGRLPLHEIAARQARYRESGVRGCWFCTQPPAELRASEVTGDLIARRDLPLFEIEPDLEHAFVVHLNGRQYPLKQIAGALLGGRIAFRETASARLERAITVGFYTVQCRRCLGDAAIYRLLRRSCRGRTACGAALRWTGESAPDEAGARMIRTAVQSAVRSAIRADGSLAARLAVTRRQKPGGENASWRFGCPHCGASLFRAKTARRPDAVAVGMAGAAGDVRLDWPHWCCADGGSFC
jgi:hypothetical protein